MTQYSAVTVRVSDGEGGHVYLAWHPEFDIAGEHRGIAQGDTPEEAIRNLAEVLDMMIDHCREYGLPVPEPNSVTNLTIYFDVF